MSKTNFTGTLRESQYNVSRTWWMTYNGKRTLEPDRVISINTETIHGITTSLNLDEFEEFTITYNAKPSKHGG